MNHLCQLHWKSALAIDTTLVLGHAWTTKDDGDKSHEIQAAQQLIAALGLWDWLFTLDALHTQKTTELVIATGNHLLIQLKRNQFLLHGAMVEHTRRHPLVDEDCTHEIGQRNRIEGRTAQVWHFPPGVGTEPWHDHFRTLIRVHRQTERCDTRMKDWQVSEEIADYLGDLGLPAVRFNQAIRGHWGAENWTDHVRDTRFR